MEYNFGQIEKKWQKKWTEEKIFKTENSAQGKENYYAPISKWKNTYGTC